LTILDIHIAGLNIDTFMDALRNSQLYSKYYDLKLPAMQSRDFSKTLFDIAGATKDIGLITETAKSLGLDTTALEGNRAMFEKANAKYENVDFGVIYNVVNPKQ
jgi:3-hydroxyisobutyrate dehydrogenase-like beta-hydroxyacid dehydrogenase